MKIKYINSHNLLKIATVILNEFLKNIPNETFSY